jgi:menaquinone-dependent protoporphyrinogen oxidase
MHILVLYATVEGQTGKIAEFVAKRLTDSGHTVATVNAETSDPISVRGFDGVVLAGSVHQRRHSDRFEAVLRRHRDTLARMNTLMLSVSLSAAFAEGREEAQDFLTEMQMRTGFTPTDALLVAGAVRNDAYDAFSRTVIRNVVLRGRDIDLTQHRHEFTDWKALSAKIDDFMSTAVAECCAV